MVVKSQIALIVGLVLLVLSAAGAGYFGLLGGGDRLKLAAVITGNEERSRPQSPKGRMVKKYYPKLKYLDPEGREHQAVGDMGRNAPWTVGARTTIYIVEGKASMMTQQTPLEQWVGVVSLAALGAGALALAFGLL